MSKKVEKVKISFEKNDKIFKKFNKVKNEKKIK